MQSFEKDTLDFLLGKTDCSSLFRHASWQNLVDYALVNRALFVLALKESNCNSSKILAKHLKEQKMQYDEMVLVAEKAQRAFEKRNCKVIAMKSFPSFPYCDNDIDFVAIESFSACKKSLLENGFEMIENRSYLREPMKRFFSDGSKTLSHLHKAFSWNGIKYLDSEIVWKNRISKKIGSTKIWIPSPTDSFLIIAAHSMFENKCIYLSDFLELVILADSKKVDLKRARQDAKRFNWPKAFDSFTQQVNAINKALFGKAFFLGKTAKPDVVSSQGKLLFPFILNFAFSCSFHKLFLDIVSLNFFQIPRQVFPILLLTACF